MFGSGAKRITESGWVRDMKKPGKKGLTAGLRVPTWVGTETPMKEA